MARKNRNSRGSAQYAKPTTVGNGTLSFQLSATSTETEVKVSDVLSGIGLTGAISTRTAGRAVLSETSTATITGLQEGHYYFLIDMGINNRQSDLRYYYASEDVRPAVDAIKISSVTVGPNSGTRLPAEINFKDGQLFRCDNSMKPTKVVPSSKSPAGLWQDANDGDKVLFSIKGSNTANPVRIGVAVRQF